MVIGPEIWTPSYLDHKKDKDPEMRPQMARNARKTVVLCQTSLHPFLERLRWLLQHA